MLSVVPSSRRLAFPLIAALLALSLAGCIGDDEDVAPVDDAVFPGCEDAVMGTIGPGGDLSLENDTIAQPFTLCITNEDTEARSFVAMPNKPPKPGFVPLPAVVDPHAEHRGGAAPVLGPVTFQTGETLVLTDVAFHGTVMFMEVERMDNSLNWEILPEADAVYPVVQNQVILSGEGSGDTDAGAASSYTFDITVPDLNKIQLTLEWDDSVDDGAGGQAANEDDTLQVRLVDPSGTEVATKELTSRAGKIQIEHALDIPAFPDEITSRGMTNATAQLAVERPPDESSVGTWTVEVAVLAAPGLVPDSDGSTKGMEGGDGHQEWTIGVKAVHRWASVGFVGLDNDPDIVQANL